jgi:hypothetical protein
MISSATVTTASFTQSVTGPPFSYGMLHFDTNFVLTYSTLQTMALGVGRSNTSFQGSIGGISSSYNAIPYGGGHIPPPSASLGDAFQPLIGMNTNYNLFGAES